MHSNLGDYSDLESALNFNPPKKPKIDSEGLINLFGKLPNFPNELHIKRGKVLTHVGQLDLGQEPKLIYSNQVALVAHFQEFFSYTAMMM